MSNKFPCGVATNANNIKKYMLLYGKVEFVDGKHCIKCIFSTLRCGKAVEINGYVDKNSQWKIVIVIGVYLETKNLMLKP